MLGRCHETPVAYKKVSRYHEGALQRLAGDTEFLGVALLTGLSRFGSLYPPQLPVVATVRQPISFRIEETKRRRLARLKHALDEKISRTGDCEDQALMSYQGKPVNA